jgi:hypothetical protein
VENILESVPASEYSGGRAAQVISCRTVRVRSRGEKRFRRIATRQRLSVARWGPNLDTRRFLVYDTASLNIV